MFGGKVVLLPLCNRICGDNSGLHCRHGCFAATAATATALAAAALAAAALAAAALSAQRAATALAALAALAALGALSAALGAAASRPFVVDVLRVVPRGRFPASALRSASLPPSL